MAKVRIEVDIISDGVSALMRSQGIASAVDSAAKRIERAAGPEFYAKPAQVVGDRVMALVVPVGMKGRRIEATEKRLSKAVTACKSSAR